MLTKDKLYSNAIINVFKIKSDSIDVLKNAIDIAFSTHNDVIGYNINKDTLILYWRNEEDIIKFKKPIGEEKCFEFVKDWLYNIKPVDRQKDKLIDKSTDDDYGFGFKVTSKADSDNELFRVICMNLYYD